MSSRACLGRLLRNIMRCAEILRLVPLCCQAGNTMESISSTSISWIGADAASEALACCGWRRCMLKIWRLEVTSPHICFDIMLCGSTGKCVIHGATEVLVESWIPWSC